jgi:ABC-type phosphate transport system permease subunit
MALPHEPLGMTRRLKRIAPVKFGMVVGIIYGLISLIIVPFFLLFAGLSTLAALLGNHSNDSANTAGGIVGLIVGCIFVVFIPVLYAVLGGLMGMLAAWLYNVVAGWIGGIEFEVE